MLRLLQFLVLSTLAAMVSWLAKQTGVTIISWAGWQIEMRTSLMVAGLVMAVVLLLLIYASCECYFYGPLAPAANWQACRQKSVERALSLGMVTAFAAGDHKMARRQARKAEKLLGSGLLPDLLSAQAAHASGDGVANALFHRAFKK